MIEIERSKKKVFWVNPGGADDTLRKREWDTIKKNIFLLGNGEKKSNLKYHKKLYFDGALEELLLSGEYQAYAGINRLFEGGLLFYLMWYCPESLMDHVFDGFDEWKCHHLNKFRRTVFKVNPRGFDSDYGMCGGREKSFVKLLVPSFDYVETREYKDGKFSLGLSPDYLIERCLSHSYFLLTMRDCSPFAPGQYLWDHYAYNIDVYADEVWGTERHQQLLGATMNSVLNFYGGHNSLKDRPCAVHLREYLFNRFEAGEFPDNVLARWKLAKDEYIKA
ncbi:hypothetical protein KO528_10130 [Saccharophagus degradans]|uniref:hypothetical protein n=1 Tax=Saccharophagus degradans TaxID=86304 RepID=UPI001C08E083|nr:hypothetical protein [Saccharophagus degradans]MBU2985708.1 hypothetical protein [Saccharophagus degradans]